MPAAKIRRSSSHSKAAPRAQTVASRDLQDASGLVSGEVDATIAPRLDNTDLSVLLRGLLHELRNPLSSILTAANLVQESTPDAGAQSDETAMLLGVIKKESLRLNHILTEFSNYIKLPAPSPQAFDLVDTLRALIGDLRRDGVLHAGISIEDQLPERSLVHADPGQIRTALMHLLSNAAEAMPQNEAVTRIEIVQQSGTLKISIEENQTHAILCLSDSGAGFSAESKARAFQPFYSTKPSSVGLGMSAARAILEAAGGRAWIKPTDQPADNESTPAPQDNWICIELPRAKTEPQA